MFDIYKPSQTQIHGSYAHIRPVSIDASRTVYRNIRKPPGEHPVCTKDKLLVYQLNDRQSLTVPKKQTLREKSSSQNVATDCVLHTKKQNSNTVENAIACFL